jgi:hypothetical protein
MSRSGVIKLVGLPVIVLLAIAVYLLLWPLVLQKAEHRHSEIGLTPNEVAANGPLPGDVSLHLKDLAVHAWRSEDGCQDVPCIDNRKSGEP